MRFTSTICSWRGDNEEKDMFKFSKEERAGKAARSCTDKDRRALSVATAGNHKR